MTKTLFGVVFGAALFALLLALVDWATAQSGDNETIRGKRIVLVNDDGVPVIELLAEGGGGKLVIRSGKGKELVSLGSEELGGAVRLHQNDGKPAVALYTYRVSHGKTAGMLENFDYRGKVAVSIGSGDNDSGPTSMGAGPGGVVAIDWEGGPRRLDAPTLIKLQTLLDSQK